MVDIEQLYQDAIRREGVLKEENQRLRRRVAELEEILGEHNKSINMWEEDMREELSDE